MSKVVDRIGEYAEIKNISIRRIEKEIGASNGTLSKAIGKGKDVLSEWISLFVANFSDVNPVWLLTGKGEMIINDLIGSPPLNLSKEPCANCKANENQIIHLEELIKMHQDKNRILEDLVAQLKQRLSSLE